MRKALNGANVSPMSLLLLGFIASVFLLAAPGLLIYGLFRRSADARAFKDSTVANILIGTGAVGMVGEAFALWELAHTNFSKGRLLRIRGRARTAKTKEGKGWSRSELLLLEEDVSDLSTQERAVVAAAWLRAGELEHASVAAFSQLSLLLLEVGAPSDLVKRAHRAALDEVSHAEMCFDVAAVLGKVRRAPDVLPQASRGESRPREQSLARLVRGSLLDGALGEGVAARVALRTSEHTDHEKLRPILSEIAREEAIHAELAWDTIEWCLREGGAFAENALRRACDELAEHQTPRFPAFQDVRIETLARYGIGPDAAIEEASNEVLKEVRMRAMALLARSTIEHAAA